MVPGSLQHPPGLRSSDSESATASCERRRVALAASAAVKEVSAALCEQLDRIETMMQKLTADREYADGRLARVEALLLHNQPLNPITDEALGDLLARQCSQRVNQPEVELSPGKQSLAYDRSIPFAPMEKLISACGGPRMLDGGSCNSCDIVVDGHSSVQTFHIGDEVADKSVQTVCFDERSTPEVSKPVIEAQDRKCDVQCQKTMSHTPCSGPPACLAAASQSSWEALDPTSGVLVNSFEASAPDLVSPGMSMFTYNSTNLGNHLAASVFPTNTIDNIGVVPIVSASQHALPGNTSNFNGYAYSYEAQGHQIDETLLTLRASLAKIREDRDNDLYFEGQEY